MTPIRLAFIILTASLALAGCKIVKNPAEGEAKIAADATGDDARTAQRISDTFESKLLPFILESAQSLATLRPLISADLDAAGDAFGYRGSGEGSAWNFAVSGEGIVIKTKLKSRARWVKLDTDGDGIQDLTLQLGPVIKGTVLRDVAPMYNFDDFRDQIEFAKLGRAINNEITEMITIPEGDLVGARIRFIGVMALRTAESIWVVTPTIIEVSP